MDIRTGMLTPHEAEVLIAASKGKPLFEAVSNPPANRPQSHMLGYYVQSTLAGLEYGPRADARGAALGKSPFITLVVVNTLACGLSLNQLTVQRGKDRPYGQPIDHHPSGPRRDWVPAAVEGHPGMAIWMMENEGPYFGTAFGVSFKTSDKFPCGLSLACSARYDEDDPNVIALEATDNADRVLDIAYELRAGAGQSASVDWSTKLGEAPVTFHLNASLQAADASRFYVVIVSVTQS
jgi:hypothetical protein